MKIAYNIAGTYRSGGMERVLSQKTNWLAENGYEVIVLTTDQRNQPSFFQFDKRIRFIDLGIDYEATNKSSFIFKALKYPWKSLRHLVALARLFRKESPDIIVSMFCNDASLIPLVKGQAKTVLECHFCMQKQVLYGRKGIWSLVDRIRTRNNRRIASRYDRFIVLTNDDMRQWGRLNNVSVIPNMSPYSSEVLSTLNNKRAIAIGRYVHQKGFERLIEAWAGVARLHPDWRLDLYGEGEDEPKLIEMIHALSLDESVYVNSPSHDIPEMMKQASMLVLTSRYEGFGLVLVEAQSFGVPPVSFDCKCGPSEIIDNGISGLLVPEGDVKGLTKAIVSLIEDDTLRHSIGHNAFVSSKKYGVSAIMKQWEQLFASL